MSERAFAFEPARCTGCEACRVACSIENLLPLDVGWRRVHQGNPAHFPGAPSFHLSLACNHCGRPACLEGCPASAYTRDAATGAVLLDDARCIGCRYCSWMCPYDAPRFDAAKGLMSKCTFCHPRLLSGRAPACAAACPTGALAVEERGSLPEPVFPGLPQRGLEPGLRIVAPPSPAPRTTSPGKEEGLAWMSTGSSRASRVSLRSEWSLVAFTTLVPFLVAVQAASALRGEAPLGAAAFMALGALAGALSLLHLGRPGRAWRAFSNLRTSWLSREILAFSLFLPLASAAIWGGLRGLPSGAASLLGLGLLLSMDRVYQRAEGRPPWRIHSAEALPAGLFLAGFLAGLPGLMVPAALARLWLYLRRWTAPPPSWEMVSAAVRIAALGLPCLAAWGHGSPAPTWGAIGLVLLGEALDRASFYRGLDLPDPASGMETSALRDVPRAAADPA